MTDTVILRRDRRDKDLVAFLPDEPANDGRVMCYARLGQHSEASLDYYRSNTIPAHPQDEDAVRLLRELRGIGYRPKLKRRMRSLP
jgi:hypothetical protein